MSADVVIDTKGLVCPMPLLKTKRALNNMITKQTLFVEATDPGTVRDFEIFVKQSGHLLLETQKKGDVYCYLLQKT